MKKFNYLITGLMGSGKDQSCLYMPDYIRRAFADELKTVVKSLYLQGVEETHKHLKRYIQDDKGLREYLESVSKQYRYEPTGKNREILQSVGTWCRGRDRNIWVNIVQNSLNPLRNYVVSDLRFQNELKAFPHWKSIYIECPLEIRRSRILARDGMWNPLWEKHEAEKEIEGLQELCDYTVYNDSTLEDLKAQIEAILEFDNFVRGEVI